MRASPSLHAPHRHVAARDGRERFLVALLDGLWDRYRARVEHVRRYEALVAAHGAAFVNDHIAFRTLASGAPATGIFTVARVFEALGYVAAGCYAFPDKHLAARHYHHPNPALPKIFVSELRVWELSAAARRIVAAALRSYRPPLSDRILAALGELDRLGAVRRAALRSTLLRFFERVPWDPPLRRAVLALDEESQFGAWVLLHGHRVNHFTALVDSHGVAALGDIEKTVEAMRRAGIPMKPEIEGAPGSRLRQSATEAARADVWVRERGRRVRLPWTYAYFEIAERPATLNRATGERERFEGFLGGQATHLFELTRRSGRFAST